MGKNKKESKNINKEFRKIMKKENGITLIALVVTIIVLLILAGIVLSLTVGNNGLFEKAKNAVNVWEKASINEEKELNEFIENYEKILNNLDNNNIEENTTKLITEITGNETNNIKTTDKNGNKIVVPAGFKIVNPEEDVTKGIIIEDITAGDITSKGNQYVWIPVSNVDGEKTNTIKDNKGEEHIIELARYTFNYGTWDSITETFNETGAIETKVIDGGIIQKYYTEETEKEHIISGYTNTIAKNINKFKESVKNNGGYYLARYEAGDPTINRNRNDGSSQTAVPVFKKNKIVYNYITQPNAAILLRNLYSNQSKKYTSDLINSYTWDTAIVYIQEFSGDSDYSKQNALQYTLAKTGEATNGINNDERCHIYDMAGNLYEWSTESKFSSSSKEKACTARGCSYQYNAAPIINRSADPNTLMIDYYGFRRYHIYNIR